MAKNPFQAPDADLGPNGAMLALAYALCELASRLDKAGSLDLEQYRAGLVRLYEQMADGEASGSAAAMFETILTILSDVKGTKR